MVRFAKILVPIDVERESTPILDHAVALARAFGSRVALVHVFEREGYHGPSQIELDLAGHAQPATEVGHWPAAGRLAQLMGRVREAGVAEVRGLMVRGPAEDAVVDLARRESYDLVVMGTHGYHGLSRMVLGSVAEKVVRNCPCPVLTVRVQFPATEGAGG
ncbi:MAG TPA: universal stress protein [Thermoanaerobaculia bacterium]|nr:universal stress protein [Thermoanaerobaculia bacterium]